MWHYIRAVFLKDLRVQRVMLLLLAALGAGIAVADLVPNVPRAEAIEPVFIGLFIIAEMILAARVIQSDPTGREFRFLLTRPVPGVAVGMAKAIFLALFLVGPCWLAQEIQVARSGIVLSGPDHLLLWIESLIELGFGVSIFLLLSVFFPKPGGVVIAAILLYVGWILFTSWQSGAAGRSQTLPHFPTLEAQKLQFFQTLLAKCIFDAMALCAIVLRYWNRELAAPVGVAVAGIALALAASHSPWDFAHALRDQPEADARLSPEALSRIQMTPAPAFEGRPSYQVQSGGYNKIRYAFFEQEVLLQGVDIPYYVRTLDYHATITLRSGKTIVSNYGDFPGHGGVGGIADTDMCEIAGVTPISSAWISGTSPREFDLATYVPEDFGSEDLSGATIKGVITFEVRKAHLAGRMPMRIGASFSAMRTSYSVVDTQASGGKLRVSIRHSSIPLVLRGETYRSYPDADMQMLAVYGPDWDELYQLSSSGGGGTLFLGVENLGVVEYNYADAPWWDRPYPNGRKNPHTDRRPLPEGWQAGAEMLFIESEDCGEVQIPYEIDDVDLQPGASTRRVPGRPAKPMPSPAVAPAGIP
jgi:hypothetical protein